MDIQALKGVGRARAEALRQEGISSVAGLLRVMPREYRDTRTPMPIAWLAPGQSACVEGRVTLAPSGKPGSRALRATLRDDTGTLSLVFFNQPWVKDELHKGDDVRLYGRVDVYLERIQMVSPLRVRTPGFEPVYAAVGSVPGGVVGTLIRQALPCLEACVPETMPEDFRLAHSLCTLDYALRQVHAPDGEQALAAARRRLAFEDLVLYQIALRLLRGARRQGVRVPATDEAANAFWACLPFEPTGAQRRVLLEIAADLRAEPPMARLVQGDVGSGKTALALGAMLLTARAGMQSALMAPTEILARQHFDSLQKTLAPLGVPCALLTGATRGKERRRVLDALASGECLCVAGTHALISEGVRYRNLGLVITDEQHRFGVAQRRLLSDKGDSPNVLVMSATPIPRTLAMVLYGDLDVSVLGDMPPGRQSVKTRVVSPDKRAGLYAYVRQSVEAGAQAYVVCPLVAESESLEGVRSAEALYEELRAGALRGVRAALMHGQLPDKEKNAVMEAFASGDTRVLVSTTVIEVGVNVPAATIMVIENAERFGLSQLHQLRGRVGRGGGESWCFLLGGQTERLNVLTRTSDGFQIAEADLKARGPGAMLGTRQSGLNDMIRMALSADVRLIAETRAAVRALYQQSARAEDARTLENEALRRYHEALSKID